MGLLFQRIYIYVQKHERGCNGQGESGKFWGRGTSKSLRETQCLNEEVEFAIRGG